MLFSLRPRSAVLPVTMRGLHIQPTLSTNLSTPWAPQLQASPPRPGPRQAHGPTSGKCHHLAHRPAMIVEACFLPDTVPGPGIHPLAERSLLQLQAVGEGQASPSREEWTPGRSSQVGSTLGWRATGGLLNWGLEPKGQGDFLSLPRSWRVRMPSRRGSWK